MKKRRWWNPRVNIISICIVMVLAHAILKTILARSDIVSSIFAYGEHVPLWMALITVIFLLIRLFVIIVVPGLLAWRAIVTIFQRVNKRNQNIS
jgi:hypothetical protein